MVMWYVGYFTFSFFHWVKLIQEGGRRIRVSKYGVWWDLNKGFQYLDFVIHVVIRFNSQSKSCNYVSKVGLMRLDNKWRYVESKISAMLIIQGTRVSQSWWLCVHMFWQWFELKSLLNHLSTPGLGFLPYFHLTPFLVWGIWWSFHFTEFRNFVTSVLEYRV